MQIRGEWLFGKTDKVLQGGENTEKKLQYYRSEIQRDVEIFLTKWLMITWYLHEMYYRSQQYIVSLLLKKCDKLQERK